MVICTAIVLDIIVIAATLAHHRWITAASCAPSLKAPCPAHARIAPGDFGQLGLPRLSLTPGPAPPAAAPPPPPPGGPPPCAAAAAGAAGPPA
eukprot:5733134-Pyramimonas_sp.AAC.2